MSVPTPITKKPVVSVDLGSTYSGICVFQTTDTSPNTIQHSVAGEMAQKTNSCILYNMNKKVDSIGYQAFDKYFNLSDDEKMNYYLIEGAKKALFNNPSELTTIIENNEEFNVVDVLSDYLRELTKSPLDNYGLHQSDVKWVCTVPANWEREHVLIMKKVFYKAGLIEEMSVDEEILVFLLEPEAAAVYVLNECPQFQLKNGSKYMVVDCGGGTIDVTSVEISKEGKLKTSRYPDAVNAGSTYIDENLMRYIKKQMGDYYPHLNQIILHEIKKSWEQIKLNIEDFSGGSFIRLNNIPPALNQCPMIQRKAIVLKKEDLESQVYEPILHKIETFIDKMLGDNHFDKIVCVGGFSQCVPLISRIKEKFGQDCDVVVAPIGSESVVKGAAYLGNDSKLISTRRSKHGYGIESEVEFNHRKHDAKRMKTYTGQSLIPVVCTGVYTPVIMVNQEIKDSFSIEKQFTKNRDDTTIVIHVYRSQTRVQYVDDPSCTHLVTVNVDVSGLKPGESFRVRFSLSSASTLQLLVIPDDVGKQVEAELVFNSVNRICHFGEDFDELE